MSHIKKTASASARSSDAEVLARLGIKPELTRGMGSHGNLAISFSVICILAGGMSMFGYGLAHGGPVVMLGTWIAIGGMTLIVGRSLADVVSAYPTSGGPYFIADKLGGPRWGWYTGWLNLLGLLGAIAGIDYGAAVFTGALIQLQWGVTVSSTTTMLIFAAILILHGLLNTAGLRLVDFLNKVSVYWQIIGVLLIVGLLFAAPTDKQPLDFLLTYHNDSGLGSTIGVVAVGSLLAGYTFCGYDASSHVAEETRGAQHAAPRGIVRSIALSWVAGFVLLAGLLISIQSYSATQNAAVPPVQIFTDALGVGVAKALLLVVIVAMLFCGNAETLATSRMIFAFSRSRALPGWQSWRRTNESGTPVRAVWAAVTVPFFLALPALWSPTAYGAVTAINAVGMTLTYGIPVYLSLRKNSGFTPGPYTLGRRRRPLGVIACVYVVIITGVFCLPQVGPWSALTVETFNYAPVTLVIAFLLAWIIWAAGGKRKYKLTTDDTAQPEEEALANMGDI